MPEVDRDLRWVSSIEDEATVGADLLEASAPSSPRGDALSPLQSRRPHVREKLTATRLMSGILVLRSQQMATKASRCQGTIKDRRLIRSSRRLPACRYLFEGMMLSSLTPGGLAKAHRTRRRCHRRTGLGFRLHRCSYLYDGCAPLCVCSAVLLRQRRRSTGRGDIDAATARQAVARIGDAQQLALCECSADANFPSNRPDQGR